MGVDDVLSPWFYNLRVKEAQQLLLSGSAIDCEQYARRGVPQSMRTQVRSASLHAFYCG